MRRALPSRQNAVEGVAACVDTLDPSVAVKYTPLKHLNGNTVTFWSLALIPRLVTLYEWLYDSLGHSLSVEDAGAKSMSALFQELS